MLSLIFLQAAIPLAHLQHHQRLQAGTGEQQRPVLRNRPPIPHAALRHHIHRGLQVENEQVSGPSHVPALLRLPHRQRHAGGQNHRLPRHHLSKSDSC